MRSLLTTSILGMMLAGCMGVAEAAELSEEAGSWEAEATWNLPPLSEPDDAVIQAIRDDFLSLHKPIVPAYSFVPTTRTFKNPFQFFPLYDFSLLLDQEVLDFVNRHSVNGKGGHGDILYSLYPLLASDQHSADVFGILYTLVHPTPATTPYDSVDSNWPYAPDVESSEYAVGNDLCLNLRRVVEGKLRAQYYYVVPDWPLDE